MFRKIKPIYLDYAASTPVDPAVLAAMRPYFSDKFGNPNSLHSFGQEASAAVDESRAKIARFLGLDVLTGFREIIFTGSATEANNLALRGVVDARNVLNVIDGKSNKRANASDRTITTATTIRTPRIIVSAIEHESVLATARDLEKDGVEVVYAPVTREGVVDLEKFKKLLNERTVLVSVMYVNNETGMVQPVSEIAKIIGDFRNVLNANNVLNVVDGEYNKRANASDRTITTHTTIYPLFHIDVSQAPHVLDCSPLKLGADMMTLSGHKIYGPKGIGVLYVRNVVNANNVLNVVDGEYNKRANASDRTITTHTTIMRPVLTGARQEFGLRAGTENVPAIVGFAKALELAVARRVETVKHLQKIQEVFWRDIKKIYPKAQLNGVDPLAVSRAERFAVSQPNPLSAKNKSGLQKSPHIINVYFPGFYSHDLLVALDMAGIAVSAGSACSSRHSEPSYVLQAMGYSKERAQSSLRFSFGRMTTEKEIEKALGILGGILNKK